jgi:hypothetical protein
MEKVNEEQVTNIALFRYVVVQGHDESSGKKEDIRIQEEDEKKDVRV